MTGTHFVPVMHLRISVDTSEGVQTFYEGSVMGSSSLSNRLSLSLCLTLTYAVRYGYISSRYTLQAALNPRYLAYLRSPLLPSGNLALDRLYNLHLKPPVPTPSSSCYPFPYRTLLTAL